MTKEELIINYLLDSGAFEDPNESYIGFVGDDVKVKSVFVSEKNYPNEVRVTVTIKYDYCTYDEDVKITIQLLDLIAFAYNG